MMILFIGFALMLNPEIVEQSFVFHATVAVLKRMNLLKANVEIENIFQFVPLITIVGTEYRLHLLMNLLGWASFLTSYFIWQSFIFTHSKPVLATVRCSRLQEQMKLLYKGFRQRFLSMVDDVVDAAEVVHRLNNIIHVDRLVSNADGVCLEDTACLIMCQTLFLAAARKAHTQVDDQLITSDIFEDDKVENWQW